ncbi:MAG: UDP-N-acetyl-D-galactosamine dehydrogenase [Maribacter sp.]|jgi:UDP-N-acetyl-D-galactosamine dehydrogenase
MYQDLIERKKKISVIGLGYVGLPIALEFAKYFDVIGFDVNERRVAQMKAGIDPSKELEASAFEKTSIEFTTDAIVLSQAHFHIVAVPTDIDKHKVPDLMPLFKASESVGKIIKKGDYVIFESTVYPGCTEEDCLPIIEELSGLKRNIDFKFGYSPERINPGDKQRTLTTILKIVSGGDEESLEEINMIYGHIIKAGTYTASSVKVAEAAKVIENTQRDLNISLMNEFAIIFDKMDIDTSEVLKAAGTKWNFLKFYPGLVGGHCIGVDPYYLIHKSKQLGYDPQVIAAGRRINDNMPAFVAKKLVQLLIRKNKNLSQCKILVKGITFKENVSDIRNSKVAILIKELKDYSIKVDLVDSYATKNEVMEVYGLDLKNEPATDYDAIVVAVAHDEYKNLDQAYFESLMKDDLVLLDLKSLYDYPNPDFDYWRL